MPCSTTPSGGLGAISKSRQCPHNRLVAQIIRKRFRPEHTAAATAQIATSVGNAVSEKIVSIDPTVPRDQPLRDAIGPFKIAAPNAVCQAVSRTVDKLDDLVFIVECHYVSDRPEDFFPRANVASLARHQRRFDVITLLVTLYLGAPAFQQHFSACFYAFVQVTKDACSLLLADDRTDFCVPVGPVTTLHSAHGRGGS